MPSESIAATVFFLVLVLMSAWAVFWVIRLAVRYGMSDALRMNQHLLRGPADAHSKDASSR